VSEPHEQTDPSASTDAGHEDTPETETETEAVEGTAEQDEVPEDLSRADPRMRPPDPAGTQPRVHPESLLPERRESRALAPPPAAPEPDLLPEPVAAAGALASPATPRSDYAPRFNFVKGALLALAAGGIAVAIIVAVKAGPRATPPWSPWKPANSGVDEAVQIAAHVGPEYRLDSGKQIVSVTGGPPALDGQPMILALNKSGSQPAALSGNGVVYQLCGNGSSCSIEGGTASVERGLLLRREALELALLTFHYVSGVSQVVVTFPPPPTSTSASTTSSSSSSTTSTTSSTTTTLDRALLFRPTDLKAQLSRPLRDTLHSPAPTVSKMNASYNAKLVNKITGPTLYDYTIIQEAESDPVLLLEPPGIGS
jgi:hypothetical protein